MDVIRKIRRLTGVKRIGHSGTLDPMATGILPIFIAREATREISRFLNGKKGYQSEILLGVETDTYDREGKVVATSQKIPTKEQILKVLTKLKGEILQVPPMYSALHHKGKRLYELARQGIEVKREPRRVVIYNIEVVDYIAPKLTLDVLCSKGTYIRSLAHDLGEKLGCGAHLSALVRTYAEPFQLKDCYTLDQIERAFEKGQLMDFVLSP